VGRQSYNSPLRPPRASINSVDDESLTSFSQEILTLKTGLLKLKRILQDADVRNPFDSSLNVRQFFYYFERQKIDKSIFLQLNGMYYNLSINEGFEKEELVNHVNHSVDEENVDLKRQVSVISLV
jgi:hypothetical protein